MYDKEDFFSPEQVDEQLDLSLRLRNREVRGQKTDPNLSLVDDLRFLYGAEGTENARSLQRVWERIAEQRTSRQASLQPPVPQDRPQLRLLKPDEQAAHAPVKKRKRRSAPSPLLTALAAMLFLVIMVGSLLAIVHLTRLAQTGPGSGGSTATAQPGQWTPVPGYSYPTPGKTTSISPASTDGFSGLTFSPDGQQVAASTQGKIWIWSASNSAQPFVYDPPANNGPIVVAWSPVAPRLAIGAKQAELIDPGNGRFISNYPALANEPTSSSAARVTALAWSPDGTLLAVAGHDPVAGNAVSIWDVNKGGQPLYTFTGQRSGDAINSLSWSSDGRYVASANGQSVQAWDTHPPGGNVIFQHALTGATDVAWSPGASNAPDLAFVNNGSTQVWYVWSDNLVSSYPATPNGALSWSPDGHYLATANGHNVVIYNATTSVHLYTYSGNTHDVHSLAWSPDGNSIASGESDPIGSDHVRVWRA